MNEEEAIKYLKNIKDKDLWIRGYVYGKEAIDTVLQLLEQKDKRIDELEKALVDEAIKSTEKINKIKNKLREVQDYNLNWKDEMVFKFVMEILEE